MSAEGTRGTARAADGRELQVTRFAARSPAWATLVVAPAMGVRQDFYAPFSRFLAASGVHVLTFDHRGTGWSRPVSPRRETADVADWAAKDLDSMLLAARAAAPAVPLLYAGHSLGGQLLGVLPHNEHVRAAITVTAGSGYYRLNDRIPWQVRFFWFVAVPLFTPLVGYFPGKALRMVGDLPPAVAWQWRRWCLHPDYLLAEGAAYREAFDRVRIPMVAFSFEDDSIITRGAVDALHAFYRNAGVERRHLSGEPGRVGHFGYFAGRNRERFWAPTLAWLREKAAAAELADPPSMTRAAG